MLRQQHYYRLNHARFLTARTYRRARLFDSDRFRRHFVQTLGRLRQQQGFRLLGWVPMPEHFHLLLWPSERVNPSQIVQSLKERTAKFALFHLRQNVSYPWRAQTLEKLALPPTVHRPSRHRVWQRRFYDLNIWSARKRQEKLNYMHANPVKRGLVTSPELWKWPSFRFYYLESASLLSMDSIPLIAHIAECAMYAPPAHTSKPMYAPPANCGDGRASASITSKTLLS